MAWLTWPLAARATSALPHTAIACFFDTLYSAWTLSYESHALVSVGTRLADANIYHPASNALFYGPAALGALPLFAPVFLATGNPVLAINVTFLLGLALTGVAMHVVVRRWTGSDLAGVVAAVTVLFNRWIVWGFVPTAPHWAALFGFPLIAFAAALRLDSLRSASLLVSLVVLQCLTDLVYVAPAVLGPLSVLAAFRLLRRRSRAEGLRLLGVLGLASLMLVPIFRGYSAAQRANPDLAKQTIWSGLERVWPAVLPQRFLAGMVPFTVTPVMGGLVILGGLLALWRRRQGATPVVPGGWSQGALWTIVGAYLSLPNTGVIAGIPFVTLMGRLAHLTSILQTVRAPSRLGVAGVIGLGILSGVAFGEVCAATRAWVRPASLALVLRATLAAAAVGLSYGAYVGSYRPWTGSGRMFSAYPVYVPAPTPPSFLPLLRLSRAPLLELPVPASPSAWRRPTGSRIRRRWITWPRRLGSLSSGSTPGGSRRSSGRPGRRRPAPRRAIAALCPSRATASSCSSSSLPVTLSAPPESQPALPTQPSRTQSAYAHLLAEQPLRRQAGE